MESLGLGFSVVKTTARRISATTFRTVRRAVFVVRTKRTTKRLPEPSYHACPA